VRSRKGQKRPNTAQPKGSNLVLPWSWSRGPRDWSKLGSSWLVWQSELETVLDKLDSWSNEWWWLRLRRQKGSSVGGWCTSGVRRSSGLESWTGMGSRAAWLVASSWLQHGEGGDERVAASIQGAQQHRWGNEEDEVKRKKKNKLLLKRRTGGNKRRTRNLRSPP